MIQLREVTVRYPGSSYPAIDQLSVDIYKEEFVCVLGKSGAGKSTFIRTLNALQPVSEGEVLVSDQAVHSASEKQQRSMRMKAGMIFQHFHLIPRLTVLQNVLTGRFGQKKSYQALLGLFSHEEREQAYHILRQVGLNDMAQRRVDALSGGQKQRVGIARSLMQDPEIFLGDEPVASLDPSTSETIFHLLRKIHDEKQLLSIMNVHDVSLARKYASRILGLRDGKLVFDGGPDELDEAAYQTIYGA
ncbi:phosphonate ABC transporter ATP-binding protein [Texcoconibacillus texcoconensis]|uniref:Phosphonate transport system ATP-binding protein n=1 Tax=Texcoconibacillus texcoconensis TaxID=1095777 RepID=A0A840QT10_9BACI|nr:phosphonate transport system ATP-binding protein [Texcoconibacillus texcoconensis]